MADPCGVLDIDKIFSLKVDELKQELTKRGLPKSGNKSELQMRLLSYVSDVAAQDGESAVSKSDDTEGIDDTTEDETLKEELDVLQKLDTPTEQTAPVSSEDLGTTPKEATLPDNETKQTSDLPKTEEKTNETKVPTPTVKPAVIKPVKISLTEDERKENRGKRFGAAVSETEKKKSRLQRFSSSSIDTPLATGLSNPKPVTESEQEKINKRAERFGVVSAAKPTEKLPEADRIKLRQERFVDEKIKKRQERFGVIQSTNPSTDLEKRKQQRAAKFGIK